jgi:YidC/Oxa1 family membrane protein insertase
MKNKMKYLMLLLLLVVTTGCTTYLKSEDGKALTNPTTGQSLVENILCRPTDEETIKLYEENNYDLSKLPYCVCKKDKIEVEETVEKEVVEVVKDKKGKKQEVKKIEEVVEVKEIDCEEFKVTSGKYEGLWTSIFVKPLAWVILFFGKLTSSFGLGLIITSVLIRLIAYPLTKKSTVQAENMKKIQPEMQKIEKKYANKDQKDREVMMMKSQEMMALYKKNNVSPMAGCLPALLQLPLFIAFLDAINRVPAIFEEKFLFFHLGTTPKIGIQGGNWWYLVLTLLVAVTTYFALNKSSSNQAAAGNDMAKQTKMMTNVFTIMIIVMSIFMSSALNIYWIVSNACTLLQNLIVKRSMK